MKKERRYTIRLYEKAAADLEKYCSEHNTTIAEFIREATLNALADAARKALDKTWSPTDEYDLSREPGQGYNQNKGNWSPEPISSYADKVRARQQK